MRRLRRRLALWAFNRPAPPPASAASAPDFILRLQFARPRQIRCATDQRMGRVCTNPGSSAEAVPGPKCAPTPAEGERLAPHHAPTRAHEDRRRRSSHRAANGRRHSRRPGPELTIWKPVTLACGVRLPWPARTPPRRPVHRPEEGPIGPESVLPEAKTPRPRKNFGPRPRQRRPPVGRAARQTAFTPNPRAHTTPGLASFGGPRSPRRRLPRTALRYREPARSPPDVAGGHAPPNASCSGRDLVPQAPRNGDSPHQSRDSALRMSIAPGVPRRSPGPTTQRAARTTPRRCSHPARTERSALRLGGKAQTRGTVADRAPDWSRRRAQSRSRRPSRPVISRRS